MHLVRANDVTSRSIDEGAPIPGLCHDRSEGQNQIDSKDLSSPRVTGIALYLMTFPTESIVILKTHCCGERVSL